MLSKIESDLSMSPRYAKLRKYAEKLSESQGRSAVDKLLKKALNDSAKNVTSELKKGLLLGVAWRINTLVAKVIQKREQDKPIKFGITDSVVDYLFLKIFFDEEVPISNKKIEDAVVRHFATRNEDTHWKNDPFDASFQDITDMMKKIIDSI